MSASVKDRVSPYPFRAIAKRDNTVLAPVDDLEGNAIQQAQLSEILVKVIRQPKGGESSGTETWTNGDASLTVADVVFDTMQGTSGSPDTRWDRHADPDAEVGYNFLVEIPAEAFPEQGFYRIEFKFKQAVAYDPDQKEFGLILEGEAVSTAF